MARAAALKKPDWRTVTQGSHTLTLRGEPLETAKVAVLLLHGRGDSARGILGLADLLETENAAYAAPEAAGNAWYPQSFLQPLERNEPYLSRALQTVKDAFSELERAGFSPENVVLLGFSQGACLALEFTARNARRYGGVVAFTGGLIGPDERFETTPSGYGGAFGGTPVFLGGSDVDAHVPEARMMLSAGIMNDLGGKVDLRVYPGMGHTVNQEELDAAKTIIGGARRA